MTDGFREVPHTADLALRIWGADLEALLTHGALGMNHLMFEGVLPASATITRTLSICSVDAESLLVDWLSELAYLAESEGALFNRYSFADITDTHLRVTIGGQSGLPLQRTIKAVTYHQLEIARTPQGLEATVVFDV